MAANNVSLVDRDDYVKRTYACEEGLRLLTVNQENRLAKSKRMNRCSRNAFTSFLYKVTTICNLQRLRTVSNVAL